MNELYETKNFKLTKEEITRYSRNIFLKEIGLEGQVKLKKSKVLIIGAGGLGSPILYYLAASGVGFLKVCEYDIVDPTNLQRQFLYDTKDVGKKKSEVLKKRILEFNPYIELEVVSERLTPENAFHIIRNVDLVIDGSDNFATRFLVNDVCYFQEIPLITGGVIQFYGLIIGIEPKKTFCYRCLLEHPPEEAENCSTVGVMGSMVGVIGSLMSLEAVKYLLGISPNIMGQIIRYDGLMQEFRIQNIQKTPTCILCGENPQIKHFEKENFDYQQVCNPLPAFMKVI
ncbi:MAG: HesA/MoeB/ThiF family protein [Leptospiraceae bacterium]|nr:HesA/MoeB/ThiF family protein [Leptospiraceae bacterium]MDW7975537.1 HesA/MoeB/ThiF family protein [Leptospiraceae bacterium]